MIRYSQEPSSLILTQTLIIQDVCSTFHLRATEETTVRHTTMSDNVNLMFSHQIQQQTCSVGCSQLVVCGIHMLQTDYKLIPIL